MDSIPTGPLERDLDSFLKLLNAVQEQAREDGHWKLVSVSLATGHIDPLAVLESIYEPGERHAYIEHPQAGEAMAGAEAVFEGVFAGADRFASARAWLGELWEHTVTVGQLDLPGSGPHAFVAATFEDLQETAAPFAPCTLFVPRWQVTVTDGSHVATANLRVDPEGDVEPQARRILDAHAKFSSFDYNGSVAPAAAPGLDPEGHQPGDGDYAARVRRALEFIHKGECEKIVVARTMTLRRADGSAFRPLQVLARLRERFPSCRSYSFANAHGQSLIGATPERLVRIRDSVLETEAIAGSAPRGPTASEDAHHAASLLASDKDRREHAAVAGFIHERLTVLGIDPGPLQRARLLRLHNVQHLVTPFRVALDAPVHVLDVAAALHPTPAVSGLPQARSRELLREIEDAPRGLYAGLVGWVNPQGEGELSVALRCGFVDGARITLHAGAGIVDGSVPATESAETVTKLGAMVHCMEGNGQFTMGSEARLVN